MAEISTLYKDSYQSKNNGHFSGNEHKLKNGFESKSSKAFKDLEEF